MDTSALPVPPPCGRCSAWAPLAPRSGATAQLPLLPHTAAVPAPLPPPHLPLPTQGHLPAAAAPFPARYRVTGPSPESPVYAPAFEEIWRTPSHPGPAKLEGSRAVQSVGTTPGQPVGRSHGSAGFPGGRGTAGRGLLGCGGPRKGNGWDTGQQLKDPLPLLQVLLGAGHTCAGDAHTLTCGHSSGTAGPRHGFPWGCGTGSVLCPSAPASSFLRWG